MSLAPATPVSQALFDDPAGRRPALERDADLDFRVHLIRATTFIINAMGVPAFHLYWTLGVHSIAWGIVASVAFSHLNLWMLRRTGRVNLAAHLSIAGFWLLLLCDNIMTGGFHRPNFAWLYVIPMVAATMLDLRGAWAWVGVTLATIVGFWWLPELGIHLASAFPPEQENAQALFSRVTAVLSLGLVSTAFVLIARRARRELRAANQQLAREATYVQLLQNAAISSNEASSLEDAVGPSVDRIRILMDWEIGQAFLVPSSGALTPLSDREATETHGRAPAEIDADEPILVRALETGLPAFDADAERSMVAIPVVSEGAVIAILAFATRGALEVSDHLEQVLTHVGRQIARVAERSRLQARIRQSQKIEAVGQLGAGMAHEINNPMAYVKSNVLQMRSEVSASADLGEAADRRDDWLDLLGDAAEGIERTIAIVSEVKECSEAHDAVGRVSDLNDIVMAAREDVITGQGATTPIEVRTTPALPRVHCLPNQLQRALVNLLRNATQAIGPEGEVTVSTGTDGAWVWIAIQDDGCGIPESHQGLLFDPFFTTRAVGEGTGLGLYVAYEIVSTHGGEIRVESELGRGSRFEVRLPIESLD